MSLFALLSRAWLPLCFGALAVLGLANLWQTSRVVAGTGPFSPSDPVAEVDRRLEPVRQSLLARGVREPVGFVATEHGAPQSAAWTELYYKSQYAMIPVVLDPAYERCEWILSVDAGAGMLLTARFEPVEPFASGVALWRRRAP